MKKRHKIYKVAMIIIALFVFAVITFFGAYALNYIMP